MIETREVEVKVPTLVPLPAVLTVDCYIPGFPEEYTVADAKDLTVELYSALYECNDDKAAIRALQPSL